MKVAALQMVSGVSCSANLQAAKILIKQAAEQGAEIVVLPEYFCLLGAVDTDKLAIKEVLGRGPIQEMLSQSAEQHKNGLLVEPCRLRRKMIPIRYITQLWCLTLKVSWLCGTTKYICLNSKRETSSTMNPRR